MSSAEEIAKAVVMALEENRDISRELHIEHHKYLERKAERDRKWIEILDQVKLHLMKYGALALVTVMFVAAWQYFKISLHG